MKVGKGTFYKMIGKLVDLGVVMKADDGYLVSVNYFPVIRTLSEKGVENARALLMLPDDNKGKRIFIYYYKKGFEGLRISPDRLVDLCIAGFPNGVKEDLGEVEFNFG
jgi:hypothetical protein